MSEKRYYWLKLQKDFFKRHDIRIIEEMENGKDYILFYLKLLVESVSHEGNLRFSDTIPYNDSMLSVVTNTNVDIVRSALKVFSELGMIEILEDKTIYLTEVEKMIGSASDNDNARRQQRFRDNKKAEKMAILVDSVTNSNTSVTDVVTNSNESKSIELDIEKDIESREKRKRFVPPTLEEVQAYCKERNNNVDAQRFFDYYEQGGWKDSKGNPVKNWKQKLITWENKEPKTGKKHFGYERTNIDFEALKKSRVCN